MDPGFPICLTWKMVVPIANCGDGVSEGGACGRADTEVFS